MKSLSIALISTLLIATPIITHANCQLNWCKKAKTTAEKTGYQFKLGQPLNSKAYETVVFSLDEV